ncbi:PEP-CTERM sorting domain-containing protein [Sedimenticola hydrogenitrophicus]|uniref:PEP-CTERM sorting domain-containing protein n=1 Tax=Sedimenticola hydrogenitrophicus TaxID=2967975 RepID=UPI0021A2F462|nr:PEP-CTERM sorting domain-containing protein [Sedimenticola hydrogenitrophicus]
MKKILTTTIFALALMFSGLATAAVIQVEIDEQLPASGTNHYDLDGDGTNDIGLAEDCCYDETLWINGSSYGTDFQFAFLGIGDTIDASLDWVSGVADYTADLIIGEQYVAAFDTSIGSYYGYFVIDFDGTDTYLRDYFYEDTGGSITVASEVPVPTPLALLGLGLIGLGVSRRKA